MNSRHLIIKNRIAVLTSLTFLAVICVVVGLLRTGHAAAVTNTALSSQAPMPESGEYFKNNTDMGPYRGWFSISSGSSEAPTAWQKIYVPYNTVSPTVITITNGGGYCYSRTDNSGGAYDTGAPISLYTIQDLDQDENMVAGGGTLPIGTSNLVGGSGCHDLTLTIPASSGTRSRLYGHSGFKVYFFVAQLVSSCGGNASCTISKAFQLNASNNGLIGFSRSVNSATQSATSRPFGVVAGPLYDLGPPSYVDQTTLQQYDPPYDWTYSFQFAPRCDEDNPASHLNVYDVDNGVTNVNPVSGVKSGFSPQYLSADLYVDNRDNASYNWSLQPGNPGPHTWSADQLGPFGVNLAQTTLTFPTNSHERYRLHMNQFNYHNVIAFYVPLDQFDADSFRVNCFNSTCIIKSISSVDGDVSPNRNKYTTTNTPPDPLIKATTGSTVRLKIEMTNIGAGPWTYDPSDPNSHFALGQFNPPSGSLIDFNNKAPPPPYVIEPGEVAKFDVFVSSSVATSATYVYQMQDAGAKWFGDQCSIDISFSGGTIPPIQASCTQIGVRISGASVRTNTPTRVTFTDPNSGGVPAVTYNFNTSLDDPDFGQQFFNPFKNGLGAQLYPHVKYNILLEVQSDSRSSAWSTVGTGAFPEQCLTPSCDPLGFNDMEAGDTTVGTGKKQSYGITLNNKTSQTFNPNIYLARISSSGGVVISNYNPSNPVTARIINGNSTDLNTSFDVALSSQSTIRASLQFDLPGGAPITTIDGYYTPAQLPCAADFTPKTKPYFKVFGGDTSAGGAYNIGAGSNNCVLPGPPGVTADYGSIKAFANSDTSANPSAINKRVGASTDFGAFLTGTILTDSTQRLGFYSGLPSPGPYPSSTSPTTFANIGVPSWGGGFINHCLYDYFSAFGINVTSWNNAVPSAAITDSDTITGYKNSGSFVRLNTNGTTYSNHPTIIVEGNVVIAENIKYNSGWSWSAGTPPPFFTLVVKGSIFIDQAVTQLDGLYVAQTDSSGGGGQIYTCTNGNTIFNTLNNATCNNKLTINGSFIAQHVRLMRTNGTLRSAFLSGTETYFSGTNPNIAEQFDYNPEILMAAPTFTNSSSAATTPVRLDSLISLPPVL